MVTTVLVVPFICNPLTSQPISYSREHYNHLSGPDLADSAGAADVLEVDALIGSDVYWDLVTGRVIRGSGGPTAVETKVGWVLSGHTDRQETMVNLTLTSTHALRVDCYPMEKTLDDQLRLFWDIEALSIPANEPSEPVVEVVMESTLATSDRTHYLPHHGITREDKATSKLRIVYDASARSNGPSLNDRLYTGPKQSIFDILMRFRLQKVALVGDIEKAFLMVSVQERDRDSLRFLWVADRVTRRSSWLFSGSQGSFLADPQAHSY